MCGAFPSDRFLSSLVAEFADETVYAVATQRGVPIDAGRTYVRQVQDAVGRESAWSSAHRRAAGIVPLPAGEPPALTTTAAALALYRETAALLAPIPLPEDRAVVEQAVRSIALQGERQTTRWPTAVPRRPRRAATEGGGVPAGGSAPMWKAKTAALSPAGRRRPGARPSPRPLNRHRMSVRTRQTDEARARR